MFNTCAVRENADNRLYGNLGQLRPVKQANPGMQIAVGGCLAQKDRGAIVERAPWVDVVFGTHNIGSLPVLLERARVEQEAQVELLEALETFPSTLPARRESAYAAWVSISVGCNNTCTFCIVPSLRGKEKDRRPGEILAEIEALVADGVLEVTLLGQNVNSYGVGVRRPLGVRQAAARVRQIDGLERVRFTCPHPRDFTDDVIAAMAETPNVMPQPAHAAAVRVRPASWPRCAGPTGRSATSASSTGCARRCRTRRSPPTSSSGSRARPRPTSSRPSTSSGRRGSRRRSPSSTPNAPGTPAATMDDQVPKEVVQERYMRLMALSDEISWQPSKTFVGQTLEVLISVGEGRKDEATQRLSGRAPDNRLVHVAMPEGVTARPGDMVTAQVTYAAPHHLVADVVHGLRRTRAGDAWEARRGPTTGAGPIGPAPPAGDGAGWRRVLEQPRTRGVLPAVGRRSNHRRQPGHAIVGVPAPPCRWRTALAVRRSYLVESAVGHFAGDVTSP